MTEKRFDLVCDNNVEWLMQSMLFLPIRDKNTNKKITLKQCYDLLNSLEQDERLKQRINSRLHFYRELYKSTNDKVVKRVIEDLEDILKR